MGWPDVLLNGGSKPGTTADYRHLQHAEMFLSTPKEPRFFAFDGHPLDGAGERREVTT